MNQKEQITIKQVFPNETTSPTLLLFPTNTTSSSNDENNKLQVLIETNDSNEMNLILNTIKNMFPSANVIRTCYQDNNLTPKETPSSSSSSPPPPTPNNSKAYLSVTPTECKKATTERAASIDNSSLIISDSNSIERQESKDSGFWTRSKCSFESTKSLSIDVTAKSSQAVINTTTTTTTTVTPTPTITPATPKQEHLLDSSSVSTQFNIKNNYLTSDSLSINSYNWKKWKKGQAWRYSNTNLSEQTNNNNNDTIRTATTTNNSFCSSDNSSFSFSIDRNEDESNESYTNTTTTNNYFSNSFELATSKLSLQANNQWSSSTSKLEILSNSTNTNSTSTSDSNINSSNNLINSQKRRGKLVRDRTIDNTDDHISNNNNNNKTSSNLNLNEDTPNNNNIESREILTSSPIQSCDTSAATLSKSGRISPPEKRLSISFKSNEFNNSLEHKLMDAANLTNEKLITFIKSDEFQTALYATMPTSEAQLKQTIAKLLAIKFQLNNNNNDDELIKYLIEKNVYLQTILQQQLQLQTRSSACPSPALSPLSTSNLIPNVNKLTLLTPPPSCKSPIQSNTQYDFHQDLQMKLNLKSNDTETLSSSSSPSSFTPFQKVNNMQEQRLNANYTKMNSSFDFKYINNNYLSNNNNNNNKYMYRSNSSPSYSATLLNDTDSMVLPLGSQHQQQANADFEQPSNFISSFAFNYNKSLPPQSASNYQQFLSNQPIPQQQSVYYPINFIDSSSKEKSINNNRLIKPPAIVITESEYNANTNNAPPPPSSTTCSENKSTSEFNRNRFMNSSFHFNQSLESIMTQHSNDKNLQQSAKNLKPHVCGICQKRFARSDMLIRHSRLHSGVRPYRCNKCGQEFSRSDHLNTHLRTHTGEKPYVCPHCSYAACRKDMITRHLKVHSKNNNINNTINRQSSSFDSAAAAATSSLSLNTAPNNSYLFSNNIFKKNNLENSNHNFLFNGLTRMDVNNLENLKHKSMSSLTSF
jgi:DNA-directed RNA polymerase subunit RPC12/RpoP